jgi:uroporphyrinogen decarboxylase
MCLQAFAEIISMHLRQDHMTSQERMDALFGYRNPDRVPIGAMSTGFNTWNAGYEVSDAYEEPEKAFQGMLWTTEQYGWDPIPQYSGHTVLGILDFGGEVRLPKGKFEGALIFKRHPVETEKDVENLKLPGPKKAGRIPKAMAFAKMQAMHGLPVFFFSRSPLTMAGTITSLEQLCKWMVKKPELCRILMDFAMEHIFNVLEYWVDTFGSEKIFAWMSSPSESNQVISPKFMEKLALPYHLKYHCRLKELDIKRFGFHICGEQNLNLPGLAEASPWEHPSVLSFGHEVDIETASRFFPKDIIFGNIEPTLFQIGPPRRVYETCKAAIQKGMKAPGGFILGPGCGLPPTSPPANIYAMTKAVHDFGWYD